MSPVNCVAANDEFLAVVDVENLSLSSDETWTPSTEGEDSDDDELDDDGSIWQETAIHFKDFSISFNKVDSDLEHGYLEEVKELKKHLLCKLNTISRENSKQKTTSNANEVMNAAYNAEIQFSVLSFQNTSLIERKRDPMDFKEFKIFLRCFFGLCFYCCSLVDVLKHPLSYPLIMNTIQGLNLKSPSMDSKIARMNDLLRSF